MVRIPAVQQSELNHNNFLLSGNIRLVITNPCKSSLVVNWTARRLQFAHIDCGAMSFAARMLAWTRYRALVVHDEWNIVTKHVQERVWISKCVDACCTSTSPPP